MALRPRMLLPEPQARSPTKQPPLPQAKLRTPEHRPRFSRWALMSSPNLNTQSLQPQPRLTGKHIISAFQTQEPQFRPTLSTPRRRLKHRQRPQISPRSTTGGGMMMGGRVKKVLGQLQLLSLRAIAIISPLPPLIQVRYI